MTVPTVASADRFVLASASPARLATLRDAGASLGLAFQIIDDLLDATATSTTLVKTAGKDARQNKPTYPSLFGLDASRTLAARTLDEARQALHTAGAAYPRLLEIVDWVGSRKN